MNYSRWIIAPHSKVNLSQSKYFIEPKTDASFNLFINKPGNLQTQRRFRVRREGPARACLIGFGEGLFKLDIHIHAGIRALKKLVVAKHHRLNEQRF